MHKSVQIKGLQDQTACILLNIQSQASISELCVTAAACVPSQGKGLWDMRDGERYMNAESEN